MASVDAEWQKLCDEHEIALDEYYEALGKVKQKVAAIATGKSRSNPPEKELDHFDAAWKKLEEVKRRMDDFVKKNA